MSSSTAKIRLIFDAFIYLVILAYLIYFWRECVSGHCYTFTKYGSDGLINFAQNPIKFLIVVLIKSAFFIFILYYGFKDLYKRFKTSDKKRVKENIKKESGGG